MTQTLNFFQQKNELATRADHENLSLQDICISLEQVFGLPIVLGTGFWTDPIEILNELEEPADSSYM